MNLLVKSKEKERRAVAYFTRGALVAAIKAACYRLSLNPMIGKGRPEYGEGVRSFPVRSRLIIYHPDNNVGSVTILRVIHGARDIEQAVKD